MMNQVTAYNLKTNYDLSSLGLSNNEFKAYITLVRGGVSTARKLSGSCGVPRTKIYLILKKLMERDLVYALPETPVKYAPNSPVEAFQEYLSFRKDKTSQQVISLVESKEFVSQLEEIYRKTHLTSSQLHKSEIWTVKGRSEIFRRIKEMLRNAKKNVMIVSTEKGFLLTYKMVEKTFDKLIENGVSIKIKTPINSINKYLVHELNYICDIEHIDLTYPLIYVGVDDHECFLAHLASIDPNKNYQEDYGIFSQTPTLCNLISLLLFKYTLKT